MHYEYPQPKRRIKENYLNEMSETKDMQNKRTFETSQN